VQTVHEILAEATVLVVSVALAWTFILAVKGHSGGRAYDRLQAAVVGLVLLAAVAGAVLFLSGARPTDSLHLLYGGVAILLIPFARSFLGGATRRDTVILLVAVVTLGGVLFRLFATG
jgi:hypothetical protein